ncbi:MAG: GntR family transcriptional regulator [Rectinemataceae bacterium]|nr:GntR family transcriptional regulator [Rectinemataceae bacterium]
MEFKKTEGLSQRVSKHLANEIRSGRYKPGDRLPPEAELAAQMGVSRTILREALASLKQDGMVETRQGRGIIICAPGDRSAFRFSDVVENMSASEANYLYEMRAILEADAAALAARRLSIEEAHQIRLHFTEMAEAVRLKESGDIAHEAFNEAIAKASKNMFLQEFLTFLHARLRKLSKELRLSTMMDPNRAAHVIEEHKAIADAILSRNSEEARAATLQHLRNAADRAGLSIFAP